MAHSDHEPTSELKTMKAAANGDSIAKAEARAERQERLEREMQGNRSITLDPTKRSVQVQRFESMLRERVVGQAPAIEAILDSFSKILAGVRNTERPLLTLLFLGPTGVGKTETVKALGDRKSVV